MTVTIELPDTINWKAVIRDFRLMIAMKETEFSEPNNLERLGIVVIQVLLKNGKLKDIGNEKPQRKRK